MAKRNKGRSESRLIRFVLPCWGIHFSIKQSTNSIIHLLYILQWHDNKDHGQEERDEEDCNTSAISCKSVGALFGKTCRAYALNCSLLWMFCKQDFIIKSWGWKYDGDITGLSSRLRIEKLKSGWMAPTKRISDVWEFVAAGSIAVRESWDERHKELWIWTFIIV